MRRRNSYTAAFKLQVVQFAETNGKRAAARNFAIDESNVRLWCRTKDKLDKMPKSKKAARGLSASFPDLEQRLGKWICDRRNEGHSVSLLQTRIKAKQLASEMNIVDFKASAHWCYRILPRKKSTCRQTSIGPALPNDQEVKLAAFQTFINQFPLILKEFMRCYTETTSDDDGRLQSEMYSLNVQLEMLLNYITIMEKKGDQICDAARQLLADCREDRDSIISISQTKNDSQP